MGDLDKEMTEAETNEKDAQAEYEQMMKDSAAKRRADSSALADKGSAKADTEAALQEHAKQRAGDAKDLMATMKTISALHAECDWLLPPGRGPPLQSAWLRTLRARLRRRDSTWHLGDGTQIACISWS